MAPLMLRGRGVPQRRRRDKQGASNKAPAVAVSCAGPRAPAD